MTPQREPTQSSGARVPIDKLLAMEKRRRGVPSSQLVFAGIHDVAQFWWCGMYAVRKERHVERDIFAAYLEDRVRCARYLGVVSAAPKRISDLLTLGSEITLEQVEGMAASLHSARLESSIETKAVPPAKRRLRTVSDRYEDGAAVEATFAETYPTFRWNFAWRDIVLVGMPDGLTADFVYEFKSAGKEYWAVQSRPIAEAQADMYGIFFRRSVKRIQVRLRDSGQITTSEGPIDQRRAELTLEAFHAVERGQLPVAPEAFKCRRCEHAEGCPLRQA